MVSKYQRYLSVHRPPKLQIPH
ncbi:BgTH12-06289 [Blumeria graminis f. sp. triticale]|uniref:Bgt-50599 n=2 Tax=Blumeria graminis TaxID=34373 RepID=A0A9X9LAK8_BLUGR|nr:BgTH12-06289 [Blumeria graminis f. sp. triticale]VCU40846.1 Bgt-50599 [Blumeria graminis f. sp. tritici]